MRHYRVKRNFITFRYTYIAGYTQGYTFIDELFSGYSIPSSSFISSKSFEGFLH